MKKQSQHEFFKGDENLARRIVSPAGRFSPIRYSAYGQLGLEFLQNKFNQQIKWNGMNLQADARHTEKERNRM